MGSDWRGCIGGSPMVYNLSLKEIYVLLFKRRDEFCFLMRFPRGENGAFQILELICFSEGIQILSWLIAGGRFRYP